MKGRTRTESVPADAAVSAKETDVSVESSVPTVENASPTKDTAVSTDVPVTPAATVEIPKTDAK